MSSGLLETLACVPLPSVNLEGFERTIAGVPDALARAAQVDLPPPSWLDEGAILTTGVGLAGGTARAVAETLSELGHPARFASLSAFAGSAPPTGHTTLLFSQSLSPNARLAVASSSRRKIAFTAVRREGEGAPSLALRRFLGEEGHLVPVPGHDEHGGLVRIQSPVTSLFIALRWIAEAESTPWAYALPLVPELSQSAFHRAQSQTVPPSSAPAAFVCAGLTPSTLFGLSAKWGETLFDGPPPIFDALELGHGPLQCLFASDRTLVVFARPEQRTLLARVQAVLDPRRHTLITLEARLPGPLALFEWSSGLDALLLSRLERSPPRGRDWPARSRDAPLYDYGA